MPSLVESAGCPQFAFNAMVTTGIRRRCHTLPLSFYFKRSDRPRLLLSRPSLNESTLHPMNRTFRQNQARMIEGDEFPFEELSIIAEQESWRKEVNRPTYHLHKWWAQRLGSVFRSIILATFAPWGADVKRLFFEPTQIRDVTIFDPFMGSGTTIGEALKLGARAIGRDINPVAYFNTRNAFQRHSREEVLQAFFQIQSAASSQIQNYYQSRLSDGSNVQVLYYFWVKQLPCPACDAPVDLFSSYIFAGHAYPARYPEARAICPNCDQINEVRYNAKRITCVHCKEVYSSQGPANRTKATCPHCKHIFPIARTAKAIGHPPGHRMYAKMVLMPDGESKAYLPIHHYDLELYDRASLALRDRSAPFPEVKIQPGYNTDQVLAYGYTYWHQMFNDRQLLCLDILGSEIRKIENPKVRKLFVSLFSGALEFNNMFASFKGEGTGAVRHMFSHHILKPERTPLEANLWGTSKSSGSFSTLFKSRILRALEYANNPFEIRPYINGGKLHSKKVFHLSSRIGQQTIASNFKSFDGKDLYLSCGDSSATDIPDESVDAVITDPPFFDNVHYSQLADFFHIWQQHLLGEQGQKGTTTTTRSDREVQHSDVTFFTERLQAVFSESCRVLRKEGLLIFTYHHSRSEGWSSILKALHGAGFGIVATHPIKSEMSVAQPKHQASEPIDLDVIVVCRKLAELRPLKSAELPIHRAESFSAEQIRRFNRTGRALSRGDVRVVFMSQFIKNLSSMENVDKALGLISKHEKDIAERVESLYNLQEVSMPDLQASRDQLEFSFSG